MFYIINTGNNVSINLAGIHAERLHRVTLLEENIKFNNRIQPNIKLKN